MLVLRLQLGSQVVSPWLLHFILSSRLETDSGFAGIEYKRRRWTIFLSRARNWPSSTDSVSVRPRAEWRGRECPEGPRRCVWVKYHTRRIELRSVCSHLRASSRSTGWPHVRLCCRLKSLRKSGWRQAGRHSKAGRSQPLPQSLAFPVAHLVTPTVALGRISRLALVLSWSSPGLQGWFHWL